MLWVNAIASILECHLMIFKQSTIEEILNSERDMVITGVDRYGSYYNNALALINILSNEMIKTIKGDRYVFAIFLSQIKNQLTLSLFSTLRLHNVQAMMNLRQVLEAGACAAYALANTNEGDFAVTNIDGTLNPSQKLTKKRYDWLEQNYPEGSETIKQLKNMINDIGSHANIISAQQTFKYDVEARIFNTPFFDYEDEVFVKSDLWLIANITLGLIDLFYGINQKCGAITLQNGWTDKYHIRVKENERLRGEMQSHERFKK